MERYFKDMKKMLQYQRGDNLISELEVILVGIKRVELGGFRLELRGKNGVGSAYSQRTPIYIVSRAFQSEGSVIGKDGRLLIVHCRYSSESLRVGAHLKVMKRGVDTISAFERCLECVRQGDNWIRDILLGLGPPSLLQEVYGVQFKQPGLDRSQREAVLKMLSVRGVAVLEGPPGTGKTSVLG